MTLPFVPHAVPMGSAQPVADVLVLHGILGSGRNLRTFAQKLVQQTPKLRYWLVDLRNHGDSQRAPPPHTLDACARDLDALVAAKKLNVHAVIGHSYGGKVALQWLVQGRKNLKLLWVLDTALTTEVQTTTGQDAASDDVERVIAALRTIPQPLVERADVVKELTDRGFSPAIGNWMTTNLQQAPDGLRWRFELDAVEQMLASYVQTDVWPLLEKPPADVQIHVVRAERSRRWPPQILQRFQQLPPQVSLDLLPDAGHWLHVDQPDALVRLMGPSLAEIGT